MKNRYGNRLIRGGVIMGDFALLNGLLLFFIVFFPNLIPPVLDTKTRVFAFICNVAMAISIYFFGPMIYRRYINLEQIVQRIAQQVLTQTIFAFVFIRILYNNGGMFRFMLYYTPSLFLGLCMVRVTERMLLNWYRQRGGNTRLAVFVGSDPANLMVYRELTDDPSTGYKVAGYYGDTVMEGCPQEFRQIGTLADLERRIANSADDTADELFCCLPHQQSELVIRLMRHCDKHLVRFYYVPQMPGNFSLSLKPERFGSLDLFTNHREPLADPVNRFAKRLFDLSVSLVVCLLLLPLLPFIALAIKLQSHGPVFFTQQRTGLNGLTFRCYKFRSMHVNNRADMEQATLDDPRKFPFGAFMRKYNIDEFPQFFNVLKGDMSIVGPRPHMLHHTEIYSMLIDKYMVRHFYKPGITGWAQATGFRGETRELWQMEERIRRDIWYIENWSFWLDLRIIYMTAISMARTDSKAY